MVYDMQNVLRWHVSDAIEANNNDLALLALYHKVTQVSILLQILYICQSKRLINHKTLNPNPLTRWLVVNVHSPRLVFNIWTWSIGLDGSTISCRFPLDDNQCFHAFPIYHNIHHGSGQYRKIYNMHFKNDLRQCVIGRWGHSRFPILASFFAAKPPSHFEVEPLGHLQKGWFQHLDG